MLARIHHLSRRGRTHTFLALGFCAVLLVCVVVVFATNETRQLHVFPTQVSSDGWMHENNAMEQALSAQAVFEDFNRDNSAFVIATDDDESTEGETKTTDEISDAAQPRPTSEVVEQESADDSSTAGEQTPSESEPTSSEEEVSEQETSPSESPSEPAGSDSAQSSDTSAVAPLRDMSPLEYLGIAGRGIMHTVAFAQGSDTPATDVAAPSDSSEVDEAQEPAAEDTSAPESHAAQEEVSENDALDDTEANVSDSARNAEDDVRVCTVLGIECRTMLFSGFDIGSVLQGHTVKSYNLRLSLGSNAEEGGFTPDKLLVRYYYGGTWHVAGEVVLDGLLSNWDNGGHFNLALPDLTEWDALRDFQVELEYVRHNNVRTELFVDSIWVDTVYEVDSPDEPLPVGSNILAELAVLEDSGRPDLLLADNKRIELVKAVADPESELIIRSDEDVYNGLTSARAYVAVTNTSDDERAFDLTMSVGKTAEVVRLLKRDKNVSHTNDVSRYSEVAYFCEAGWQVASGVTSEVTSNEWRVTSGDGETTERTDQRQETTDTTETSEVKSATEDSTETADVTNGIEETAETKESQKDADGTRTDADQTQSDADERQSDADTDAMTDDELFSSVTLSTTYSCKATGAVETCNSFNAEKTNCIVGNERVTVEDTMVYDSAWRDVPLVDAEPPSTVRRNFLARLFTRGDGPSVTTSQFARRTSEAHLIAPHETSFFAVDLSFPVQQSGEVILLAESEGERVERSIWWRSAFRYRMPVMLEPHFEGEATEVPSLYKVTLDRASEELFTFAALDGADVRFYDPLRKREVPTLERRFSYVEQEAAYGVELRGDVPLGTTTLYAYFGNEYVSSDARVSAPAVTDAPIPYVALAGPDDGVVLSLTSERMENSITLSGSDVVDVLASGESRDVFLPDTHTTLEARGPLAVALTEAEHQAGGRLLQLSLPSDTVRTETQLADGRTSYHLARYRLLEAETSVGALEELPLPAISVYEVAARPDMRDRIKYLRDLRTPRFHDFREELRDLQLGERVEFKLKYRAQKSRIGRVFKGFFRERLEEVQHVTLMRGGAAVGGARFEVVYDAEGEWTIRLVEMPRAIVPGKYTLDITIDETGTLYTDSIDFYWGVLAVNTPSSVNRVNDLVELQMAALDDKGDTICDADLRLVVTTPTGETEELPVEPQSTCGPNNVTDSADYLSWYRPRDLGTYALTLTHINLDGEVVHRTTDSFEVREEQRFTVVRTGATRIWPKASYTMELSVTAKEDFTGTIVEALPESFVVLEAEGAETTKWGNAKRIVWDVTLAAGETKTFRYEYDAPDVSPYLYLLGPAEVRVGDMAAFTETRTWKLASDALGEYVEKFVTVTPTVADAWTTIDLSGAPYNIPANAVVEMALINHDDDPELYAGVRHASSTLDRRFLLHEAETTGVGVEGMSAVVVHVTASATSSIQYYADDASLVSFRILGYWTSGVYVERFDTADPSTTDDAWVNWDLNTYGLTSGDVAEVVMVNNQNNTDFFAGVRTDASALDRRVQIHEPESGGDTFATMFVMATTATARVETYSDDDGPGIGTDVDFVLAGYWDVMPTGLIYTEKWSDLGGPSANTTWTDRRLDDLSVPSTAIAEVFFANTADANGAMEIGVRPNGSSLGRVLDLHEAEGGSNGITPSRAHVTAGSDASSTIEFYTESTAADMFYLSGYWAANNYPPDAPTLYDVPFDNEKTGSSTPYFEFSASDPDGTSDIVYQIQWDDDPDLDASPLGDRSSSDESGCSPNCFSNTVSGGDTSPFTEANKIRFTIQTPLTSGTTYYWRVRATDSAGSAIYSEWSDVLSFTYVVDTDPKGWIQTQDAQFDQGTQTGTETYGANKVRLATTPPVGAMVAYGAATFQTPHYRIWNGSAWSASSSAQSVGGQISWTTLRAAPTRNEYILGTQDTGGDVNVQVYDGGAGTWGDLLEMTGQVGNAEYKGFDIRYRSQTGDAVVAYCDGDADPSYVVWDGDTWSATSTIDLGFTQNCEWLTLAADPSSDELMLVSRANIAQADPDYEVQVFSASESTWGSSLTLGIGEEASHEGIAVAYEESGTNAVVTVSNGGSNNFATNVWDGEGWGTPATVALADDFEWGVIAADEGTDNLALCYIDEDNDVGTVFWNGAANSWGTYREHDQLGDEGVANADLHGRPVSCEYETTAGRDGYLMVPYSNTTNAEYNYYNGATWQYAVDNGASVSSITDSWTVSTVRTGAGQILAAFHDNANTQYDFSAWDGSSWTTKTTLDNNPSRTTEPWLEPIAMAAQLYQEAQGSIVSTIVDFDLVPAQPSWGEVIWNTTEPTNTDVTLQVYYATTTAACNVLVPDGVLPGNSTGFVATSSPLDLSTLSTSTYNMLCIKANLSSQGAISPTLDDWSLSWEREPFLTQTHFRWYANNDVLTPTDLWPPGVNDVVEDQAIETVYAPNYGDVLRLRLGLKDTNVTLPANATTWKLQWAEGTVCSATLSWSDVGGIGGSEPWQGYNTSATDGTTIPSRLLSTSDVSLSFEEENPTVTNTSAIAVNEEAEFDFVLLHQATSSTEYCFRLINSDGTTLSAYDRYPSLVTNSPPEVPTHMTPFTFATASTSPWFTFAATDLKGDDLHYEIQVDDDKAFGSVAINRNSLDHFNEFTNVITPADKSPFNAGETVRFIPTSSLSSGTTYWWRVRAKDPAGSTDWSEWSLPTSFTATTSLAASAWHQTTLEQFDENTLEETEATSTQAIVLTPPATVGTATSPTIDFDWGTAGNAWGSLSWSDVETTSDVKYRIEYSASGIWTPIPDSVLTGNSAGFDTSPVSLLGLDPTLYNELRLVAVLTHGGASPRINEWTLSWGYAVAQPTLRSLFDNEKTGTTTPSFTFDSTDPDGDDLQYEIQWSATPDFAASTTRQSGVDAGFVNTASSTDSSPFIEGDTIRFTVQGGDALTNGSTYWWRVRARDPGGGDTWSVWSAVRSFTVDTSVVVSTWFQTTDEQFDTSLLNDTETYGSDQVRITSTIREAMTAYAEGNIQTPRYRLWNGQSWGTEKSAQNIGQRVDWVRLEASPTRNEYTMVTQGQTGTVQAQIYTGSSTSWSDLVTIVPAVPNGAYRGYDMAYESTSGDVMVVACSGQDALYRTWDGVSWSATTTINLSVTQNCEWLQLAADPTSNELILLTRFNSAAATDYEALVWNGTDTWANSYTQGNAGAATDEGMAVMYEESGVDALIVTSNGIANNFLWARWNGAWNAGGTVAIGNDHNKAAFCRDDGTDRMTLVYTDEDTDSGYAEWDGSANSWGASTEIAGASVSEINNTIACQYETMSGRDGYVLFTFGETTSGTERYRVLDRTTPVTAVQNISTLGEAESVFIKRTGDGNILGLFFDDDADDYFFSYWNGTQWSAAQQLENDGNTQTPRREPLAIAARRYTAFTSGSIQSDPIAFSDGSGPQWGTASSSDTTPGNSSIRYQIEYTTDDGETWALVPDGVLPGNSTGTTSNNFEISSIPYGTYGTLRYIANFVCDSGDCPILHDWTIAWSEGSTVSGTAKAYDESTNITSGTVAVAVNGVLQSGKVGTISGGTWSIPNVTIFPGDVVTLFIDGADNPNEAVTVARYDGIGHMTGVELIERHLVVGSPDATTTTNADLALYDYTTSGNDEDLFFEVDGGNDLYTCAPASGGCFDAKLYVASSSTYRPDSANSGTLYAHDVVIYGTTTPDSNTLYVSGSWDNNGRFTAGGSTVVFTATSTNETIDSTGASSYAFNTLTLGQTSGNATWTSLYILDADANTTLAYGVLSASTSNLYLGGNLSLATGTSFVKGTGTTTFDGTGIGVITDATAVKQDLGKVAVNGSSKTARLGAPAKVTNLTIETANTFDVSASNYALEIVGNLHNHGSFSARNGTVTFTATTTGHVIDPGSSTFWNLTTNGVGGNWAFETPTVTIGGNLTVATGTLTLATGTTTVAGNFTNSGGTFVHNNGTLELTGTGAKTLYQNGWPLYNVTVNGAGSWSWTDQNATSSGTMRIQNGSLTYPAETYAIGRSLLNTGGTIVANGGTLRFYSAVLETVRTNGSALFGLTFDGVGGTFTMTDTNLVASGTVRFLAGTTTLPTGTFTVGGSFVTSGGTWDHNNGTVVMNSTALGRTVSVGTGTFNHVTFSSATGGWTVTESATSSGNWSISSAQSFTLLSGITIEVAGTFVNSAPAATVWDGGTLYLNSGTSYTVGAKTQAVEGYGKLMIGPNTDIKLWQSSSTAYVVDPTGSLYSQDHSASDGDLYIWGDYERTSGTEYWSHATDFDGTALGGSPRQVDVRFADGARARLDSATLEIIGSGSASTTLANQGSGAYALSVVDGTVNAVHYAVTNTDTDGFAILGSSTVVSLGDGAFTLTTEGGSMLTVSSTTIDANPAFQPERNEFSTSSGITTGYNVYASGTASSYWWFKTTSGNFDGEVHDSDPVIEPGSIRWDDSGFSIDIGGTAYAGLGGGGASGACDGVNPRVRLLVNGTTPYATSCDAGDGTFLFEDVSFSGDVPLTVYLDGVGGVRAATVSRTPQGNITDFDLYQNYVIVRHEDTAAMTINELLAYDSDQDTDIPFDAESGSVTLSPETGLYVWPGKTFAPAGNVTLLSGGSGATYDGTLRLASGSTFAASGSETHAIGGSWIASSDATFTAANSLVSFTATTSGKTLAPSSSFYDTSFTGTGGWTIASSTTVANDLALSAGTISGTADVTVTNGTLTGNGTISMSGGTVTVGKGGTFGGNSSWSFNNLTLGDGTANTTVKSGSGNISLAGTLTIAATHTLRAGANTWTLTGSGTVLTATGTFDAETSTTTFAGTAAQTVPALSYHHVVLAPTSGGSPSYTLAGGSLAATSLTLGNGTHAVTANANASDPLITVSGTVRINAGATYSASNINDLLIGGSFINTGIFTSNGGGVVMNSDDTGEVVTPGGSSFHHLTFTNAGGGWTMTTSATTTGNFSLTSAAGYTHAPGTSLAVQGMFTNGVGGSATDWTNTTLYLNSGTSYSMNTKAAGGDTYGTLMVGANTDIAMWNSTSTLYSVTANGSLYSQDHNAQDGQLYIWGDYVRTSGTEHWSYATDFDGADITGSPRQAQVYLAAGASTTLSGGTWNIVGGASATTTIQNQGSGVYGLKVAGGTFNAQYYRIRTINALGLEFAGTPTVTSLSDGDLELAISGGTMLTIPASVITTNPVKTWYRVSFATSTGVTNGRNASSSGTTASSWRFTPSLGNYYGEAFDGDPAGDPGYLIWENSNALVTISGNVYSNESGAVSALCNGSAQVVRMVIQGGTPQTTSCAAGTGLYSFSGVSYLPGDSILVYLTGTAPKAANVTIDPVTSIADMHLYESRVVVRHEDVHPITIADIAIYDADQDPDIPFDADLGSPHTLTLPAERKLIVWNGKSFRPGGNVTLASGGSGADYDGTLELQASASYLASTTAAETISVGGSWITAPGSSFTAGLSSVSFTATTSGKTVSPDTSPFYNLTFNGSGGVWTFADVHATTTNDFTVTAGSVNVASSTLGVGGSLVNSGTMSAASTSIRFTSASPETVTLGGASVGSLTFAGAGLHTMTDTNATSTGSVTISAGSVALPTGTFAVANGFSNSGGSFTHAGTLRLYGALAAQTLRFGSSPARHLTVDGQGSWSFADTNATTTGTTTILQGGLTAPTGSFAVGGSFRNSGTYNSNAGTMHFFATTTGQVISVGGAVLGNVIIQGAGGGWTMATSATTTGSFRLRAGTSYAMAASTTLEVQGLFENLVGGGATNWADSMLYLNASGTSYTVNTKAAGGDTYAYLTLGANTDVRMWDSAGATTTVPSTSSLYSMDHAGAPGDLYIWGQYVQAGGNDYWSYATDFDGTALGGSSRQVDVRIASSSSLTFSGGTLEIVGTAAATTTVAVQGSGAYAMTKSGGTLNALYYSFRNLDASGLVLANAVTVTSLSYGDFELATAGGVLLAISSGTIDQNPTKILLGNRFASTSGITGTNVKLSGVTSNFWDFQEHYGEIDGESYDDDGLDACGSIRWDDSTCLEVSQAHYRFRSDNGGGGAPDAEWFDVDWSQRKRVNVRNTNGSALTNAAVRFEMAYDEDMQADWTDVRFTDASGTTSLAYFIEEYTTSATATIWVKVPSIPANSSTYVYAYYGNAFAENGESGSSTFTFFDDFEDDSLSEYSGDTSYFDAVADVGAEGAYILEAAAGYESNFTADGIYRTGTTFSQGSTIRFMQYVDSTQDDEPCTLFGVQSPGSDNDNYAVCLDQYPSDKVILAKDVTSNDGSGSVLASTTVSWTSGWYTVEIDWLADDSITVSVYNSAGSLFATTNATDGTYTAGGLGFSFWGQRGGWDFYSVRPYAASEPSVTSFGLEQGRSGASWSAPQDTAVTQEQGQTFRVRFSIENSGPQITGKQWRLQYADKTGYGTCNAVPAVDFDDVPVAAGCGANAICMTTTSQYADGDATQELLTSTTFLESTAGKLIEDPNNQTAAMTLDQNRVTEVEYALSLTENAVSNAYCMRVSDGGLELDSYQVLAEVTAKYGPQVTSWSLNMNDQIALTEGVTTAVVATGTVTDLNGFEDILYATSTFYRSALGSSCASDLNNCYQLTSLSCPLENCSGTSCDVTCTADMQYFADPTDPGSDYEGQTWYAKLFVLDLTGNEASTTAEGVDVQTLRAVSVTTGGISYGTLELAADTEDYNATSTLQNTGNAPVDIDIEGSDLTASGSSIPAGNQKFATSTFTYSACSICTALSGTVSDYELDLPKPTSTSTPVTDDLYWGIYVPSNTGGLTHAGQNTFYAVGD